jgi:hypothetical protein
LSAQKYAVRGERAREREREREKIAQNTHRLVGTNDEPNLGIQFFIAGHVAHHFGAQCLCNEFVDVDSG